MRSLFSSSHSLGPFFGITLLLVTAAAGAQPLDQPADARPELPDFAPDRVERGNILPPLTWSEEPGTSSLSGGKSAFVLAYQITGNTILTTEELDELTAEYTGREVSFGELEALRDRITLAYIERGYVTSGAVIPEQTIEEGIVRIQITEGTLARVKINTDGRYHPSALRRQITKTGERVNVNEIEERLQLLQRNERIRSLQTRLVPGEQLGESILEVDVVEARPYRVSAEASNHESPAVGAYRGRLNASYLNVLGIGDTIGASFDVSEGLLAGAASYEVPIGPYGTQLEFHGSYSDSEVIEKPFEDLDIESRSWTAGLGLRQPVLRTLETDAGLFMTAELRRSRSYLLGSAFSFSPGPESGVSKLSVLRFGGDWSRRTRSQVIVVRTQFSVGVDALGATSNSGGAPDGEFFSWLGQAQVARRVSPLLNTLFILRGDVQLSTQPLLGLEQFAVGGHASVRGYRENALVRDNGVLASIEARVPVLTRGDGTVLLEVGPLVDYGRSWNEDRITPGPEDTLGIGLSLRASITPYLKVEAAWAEDVLELDSPADKDLQDHGFQFRIVMELP